MTKEKMSKVGILFHKEMREIKIERRLGIDKNYPKELSNERLTDAIIKQPEWPLIKNRLEKLPREEEIK